MQELEAKLHVSVPHSELLKAVTELGAAGREAARLNAALAAAQRSEAAAREELSSAAERAEAVERAAAGMVPRAEVHAALAARDSASEDAGALRRLLDAERGKESSLEKRVRSGAPQPRLALGTIPAPHRRHRAGR